MDWNPLWDARAGKRLRTSAYARTAEVMVANGATYAEVAEALWGSRTRALVVAKLLRRPR